MNATAAMALAGRPKCTVDIFFFLLVKSALAEQETNEAGNGFIDGGGWCGVKCGIEMPTALDRRQVLNHSLGPEAGLRRPAAGLHHVALLAYGLTHT